MKPKRTTVRRDGREVTVWPTTVRGRIVWRFGWRDDSGRWRQTTRATKAEAEHAAFEHLGERSTGGLQWSQLPAADRRWLEDVRRLARDDDRAAVLAFLRGRQRSQGVTEAVAAFFAHKIAESGETRHIVQMRRDLDHLAASMGGAMLADVSLDALKAWWADRSGSAGRHRQQGIRRTLVSFWRWARVEGLAGPDPVTVAERLPSLSVGPGKLRVLDPVELRVVLGAVDLEFLPWILFGAFAGMRPEEISPTDDKPGLLWDHIDWRFNVIRLPAEVAKVRRARVIPIVPTLRAWFAHIGAAPHWTGRVCRRNPSSVSPRETTRLGKVLDAEFERTEGWPADALRHSFGSYRNAMIRSLAQVAEEMGTSETMLHRHYHAPRTVEEGEAWFAVMPPAAVTETGTSAAV